MDYLSVGASNHFSLSFSGWHFSGEVRVGEIFIRGIKKSPGELKLNLVILNKIQSYK